MKRPQIRLVENWRHAYKFLSVQLAALLALISAAYDYLPSIQQYLPEGWVHYMALAIIATRLIQQRNTGRQ